MLRFEFLRNRNILIVTPDGPLEKADFERLAGEVAPIIASKGKLTGLMVYGEEFHGWTDFGAFISHLRFVAAHHRQIERVAAVTGGRALMTMTRIAGCFVKPEIKAFRPRSRERSPRMA